MNRSIRIPKGRGGIKVRMPSTSNTLNYLSLDLGTAGDYPSEFSDYGVVVGRVTASGVGVPNAKVSIFVPLDETDSQNPRVRALYPYSSPSDTDADGNRYNLLPKFRSSPLSNLYFGNNPYEEGYGTNPYGIGYRPDRAIGTFPSQEEAALDADIAYVAAKYYRYTTKTNESGDFCIMGVPTGEQTLHIDADLTDIGRLSMKPIVLSRLQGFPEGLFDKEGTRIRRGTTLSEAKHIISQDTTVSVLPFWGDRSSGSVPEVGITRVSQSLNFTPTTTFTLFHSGMTMAQNSYWYDYVSFRVAIGPLSVFGIPVRIPVLTFDFTSNPCTVNGGAKSLDPFVIQFKPTGIDISDAFDVNASTEFFEGEPTDKLFLSKHRHGEIRNTVITRSNPNNARPLSEGEYASVQENGSIAMVIPCDSRKVVTAEDGSDRVVPDDSPEGVFTRFRGCMHSRLEAPLDAPLTKVDTARVWMKVPQNVKYEDDPEAWITESYEFRVGRIYSVAQRWFARKSSGDDSCRDYDNAGMIENLGDTEEGFGVRPAFSDFKLDYDDPEGCAEPNGYGNFMDRNVHLCLYYLQYGYKNRGNNRITCEDIVGEENISYNGKDLGAGLSNAQHLARGDNFKTNFVEIPRRDIYRMLVDCPRSNYSLALDGDYYGVDDDLSAAPASSPANVLYFKGIKESDCLYLLYDYNII